MENETKYLRRSKQSYYNTKRAPRKPKDGPPTSGTLDEFNKALSYSLIKFEPIYFTPNDPNDLPIILNIAKDVDAIIEIIDAGGGKLKITPPARPDEALDMEGKGFYDIDFSFVDEIDLTGEREIIKPTCNHCKFSPAISRGYCSTCFNYFKRYGFHRSPELLKKDIARRKRKEIKLKQEINDATSN